MKHLGRSCQVFQYDRIQKFNFNFLIEKVPHIELSLFVLHIHTYTHMNIEDKKREKREERERG